MAERAWLRSSSLRVAVWLTLVIWLTSSGVMVAIVALSERAMLSPVSAALDEHIDLLVEQVAEDEFAFFPWFDRELDERLVDIDDLDEDDEERLLDDYAAHLQEASVITDDVGESVRVRLWLLGYAEQPGRIDRPLAYYAVLILEQLPDATHDFVIERLKRREREWPERWRWETMSIAERTELLIHAPMDDPSDRRCVRDSESNRTAPWRRVFEKGDYSAFNVPSDRLGSEQRVCWAKALPLGTTRVITYGIEATDTLNAVQTNRRWRAIGVGASLLLSILLGGVLGRTIYSRLHVINVLTERVREGDLDHRLRLRGTGDDFDRLSTNVNAMLDRIVDLMNGVKEVSDNIAHDLRSPLTRLRNRIEQLEQMASPTAEDIRPIAEQTDELLAMFTSLLRIAQLEQKAQRQPFATLDLAEVAKEVVDLYEPVFAESGSRLTLTLPSGSALITGDRPLWMQVFNNLLENSLKYAAESPRVSIAMQSADRHWIVQVRDQGPGVPEHALERLTERFYRAESHRERGGTGLGLALVAAICRVHNATIDFANDGGLVVTIRVEKRA
ncbi:MAG: HAMP domain-containing sensor histidine kinase [Pseudomonadota bacterium]